ncbi:MAG: C2H2-type zinc finger protein [Candidatus Bathyarchaeota archaeon]|nr:C2H2-type zinc finger protein [Candidatus Bathyarchaeota archaeon]
MVYELKKVYRCVVCGARFSNKKALAGHFKKHSPKYAGNSTYGGTPCITSFYTTKEKIEKIKIICKEHGTTICSLINRFLDGVIKGEEKGIVVLSENPILFMEGDFYLGKPRSKFKKKIVPTQGVFCPKIKDFVEASKCAVMLK